MAGIHRPTSGSVDVRRPGLRAARARRRVPPRADRPRERLPQRLDPRPRPSRRSTRAFDEIVEFAGLERVHRLAGEDLLERHVRAARLLGRGARRPRDPDHRRGHRRRRRGVPAPLLRPPLQAAHARASRSSWSPTPRHLVQSDVRRGRLARPRRAAGDRRRSRRRPQVPRQGQRRRDRAHRRRDRGRGRGRGPLRPRPDRDRRGRVPRPRRPPDEGGHPLGAAHGADALDGARRRSSCRCSRSRSRARPACTWPTPACRPATSTGKLLTGRATSTTPIDSLALGPGQYTFSVAAHDHSGTTVLDKRERFLTLRVQPGSPHGLRPGRHARSLGAAGERAEDST